MYEQQELGAEAELSLVEGEGESNRKKKKRKGREKAKAAVERDPLMLELAAVFQALEVVVCILALALEHNTSCHY